jgi:hypothetical protein
MTETGGAHAMRIAATIAMTIQLGLSSVAYGFRCGTSLVKVGDTKLEVLEKCGEPTFKELIKTDGLIVEKWYYDCGPQRFIQILTFSGGSLQKLETGDYGRSLNGCP